MRLNVLVLRTLSIRFNSLNAMNTFQQLCCLDSEDKTAPDRDTESDTKTVTLVQLVLRTSLYGLNSPGASRQTLRPVLLLKLRAAQGG